MNRDAARLAIIETLEPYMFQTETAWTVADDILNQIWPAKAVLDQIVADAEEDDLYTRTDGPAPTTR